WRAGDPRQHVGRMDHPAKGSGDRLPSGPGLRRTGSASRAARGPDHRRRPLTLPWCAPGNRVRRQSLTDPLNHERGALTGDPYDPVNPVGTQGLPRLAQLPDDIEPPTERNVTVLEGSPNCHGELAATRLTLEHAPVHGP